MRFSVDTNCVNARQRIPSMNKLEEWGAQEIIELLTSAVAQNEMTAGVSSIRKKKAYQFIFTESLLTTDEERELFSKIQTIIFPSGNLNENQLNDVHIVFNSVKHGVKLITNDGGSKSQPGGIIGNRQRLNNIGAVVLNPGEAVLEVRKAIVKRDDFAKQWAEHYAESIPDWVGSD